MTVTEAIQMLELMRTKHGDVPLFFDCPRCEKSFTPNTIATSAVHLSESPAVPSEETPR